MVNWGSFLYLKANKVKAQINKSSWGWIIHPRDEYQNEYTNFWKKIGKFWPKVGKLWSKKDKIWSKNMLKLPYWSNWFKIHLSLLFESTSSQIIRCYLRLNVEAQIHKKIWIAEGTQIICRYLVLNQSCSVSGVVKEYRQNGIASFMLENLIAHLTSSDNQVIWNLIQLKFVCISYVSIYSWFSRRVTARGSYTGSVTVGPTKVKGLYVCFIH